MKTLFFSYSHVDQNLRDELEKQLAVLKRNDLISAWHDRKILAGQNLDHSISQHLEQADIILFLVSPDFISSDYCFDMEMKRALERSAEGKAKVVPVILRPCQWQDTALGKLKAVPRDGKAVTNWANQDEAFLDVADEIKRLVGSASDAKFTSPAFPVSSAPSAEQPKQEYRSSNLRLRKTFTDLDQGQFRSEGFEFMAKYFENSLSELQSRNQDVETRFERIDSKNFTAQIYRNGKVNSECRVTLGGMLTKGISFSFSVNGNGYSEALSEAADDQHLYFKSMGMQFGSKANRLSFEGAAELFWSMLISRLQ